MTINNINLIGIEADSYYFLNPIFIRIESQTKFITKATFKFTNKSAVPTNTAAKFSKKLVEEGLLVLVEEASGSRPAMYSFEPLMKLVRI